jgi:hypothetical protein
LALAGRTSRIRRSVDLAEAGTKQAAPGNVRTCCISIGVCENQRIESLGENVAPGNSREPPVLHTLRSGRLRKKYGGPYEHAPKRLPSRPWGAMPRAFLADENEAPGCAKSAICYLLSAILSTDAG